MLTDADGMKISSKPNADPRTLFSMLGVAIRIAKRIGIHIEAINSKHNMLEAELRRRLWWVLTMFDERLSEMAGYKDASLAPTWDCRIPSNIDDVDLRVDMKNMPPSPRIEPSEAIFAVVNSEIGNFVRRSLFHLDFTNPILKTFITDVRHGPIRRAGELEDLKKMIEDRYLKHCKLDIPLHFMTIWGTRMTMAKKFMMNHYSKYAAIPGKQTEEQSDTALGYAIEMLEADTAMSKSLLTARFTWYLNLYFPFPAFMHVVQDLRKRPGGKLVEQAWQVLSEHYHVRFLDSEYDAGMFYKVFPRIIMATWAARKDWLKSSGLPIPVPPPMVTSIQMVTAALGFASLSPEENDSIVTPEMTVDVMPPASVFPPSDGAPPPSFAGLSMLPDSFWDLSQPMDLVDPQMNWPGMNWPTMS